MEKIITLNEQQVGYIKQVLEGFRDMSELQLDKTTRKVIKQILDKLNEA